MNHEELQKAIGPNDLNGPPKDRTAGSLAKKAQDGGETTAATHYPFVDIDDYRYSPVLRWLLRGLPVWKWHANGA